MPLKLQNGHISDNITILCGVTYLQENKTKHATDPSTVVSIEAIHFKSRVRFVFIFLRKK